MRQANDARHPRSGLGRPGGVVVALTALIVAGWLVSLNSPARGDADGAREAVRATATGEQRARGRPNIVFIMVDDMRDDDLVYMPRTRRLIEAQGVRFVNSFAPFPLCCPARASVLTGQYTHNHGVYDVVPPWGFTSFDDRRTIATALQASGYATVYVGKYLNGYGAEPEPRATGGKSLHYVPRGWTEWRASIDGGLRPRDPRAGGTYKYFDTTLSDNGEGFDNYAGRYQSDVYGRLSERIIERRAADGVPFFYYLSFTAPHAGAPLEPDDPRGVVDGAGQEQVVNTPARPESVWGRFDDRITAAPGADWDDPDFSDKPDYLRRLPPLNDAVRAAVLELTRQRAEALSVVDRQVGRVMGALSRSGELDNTLVVFTSDNGFFLGEQRRPLGKTWPHEPSLRVPLLMRGPGIPAGETRRDPFTSIDVAPTLARVARTSLPWSVDGTSLLGVARHGDAGWDRAVLTESGPYDGVVRDTDLAGNPLDPGEAPDIRYTIGVRSPDYLYVDVATGEEELYDLGEDPEEYDNLVGDPAYASQLEALRRTLRDLRACVGDTCRSPLPPELTRP